MEGDCKGQQVVIGLTITANRTRNTVGQRSGGGGGGGGGGGDGISTIDNNNNNNNNKWGKKKILHST